MSLAIRRLKNMTKRHFQENESRQTFCTIYIRIHGTLKGYKDESIVFAKPL